MKLNEAPACLCLMDLSDFLPSLLPVFDMQLTFSPSAVPVLHPSVPFLTKLRRRVTGAESTRPKSKEKNTADVARVEWMVIWLIMQ